MGLLDCWRDTCHLRKRPRAADVLREQQPATRGLVGSCLPCWHASRPLPSPSATLRATEQREAHAHEQGGCPCQALTPRLSPLWHLPRSLSRQGVIVISDTEHFNKTVDEAKAAGKKCVVDFTATWCGPCKMIKRTCAASEGCCQGLWNSETWSAVGARAHARGQQLVSREACAPARRARVACVRWRVVGASGWRGGTQSCRGLTAAHMPSVLDRPRSRAPLRGFSPLRARSLLPRAGRGAHRRGLPAGGRG